MKFNNQWNLIFFLFAYIYTYTHAYQGRPHVISLVGGGGGGGGGGLCKSWTFYPGQYWDLSEGSTKTKWLKVGRLIM